MGVNYRIRGVLVSLRGFGLNDWELDSLASENAAGGFPALRSRVDPALPTIAASRSLDRAAESIRLIRFDGRPPATDLPPLRGGAVWP